MWQFWVEIVLGALLLVRVGHAQMHEYLIHHCSVQEPKSFVLQHFEHGNALEIHNEMLFKDKMGIKQFHLVSTFII